VYPSAESTAVQFLFLRWPGLRLPMSYPAGDAQSHEVGEKLKDGSFSVSQQDKAPLMTYSADRGRLHGGAKWFFLR
jgi:hypothetical protein